MTPTKLKKLEREIAGLRQSSVKALDLQKVAKKLGRKKVNRGKEPTWESAQFDELRPLAIPHHGGKDLSPGTKNSILNQLEDDIIAWSEYLDDAAK